MPYVEAVIFTTRVTRNGKGWPDAVADIDAWAIANDEFLPGGQSGIGPFRLYSDLTGIARADFTDGKVFIGQITITTATAQQFSADPRIFVLGRRIMDDEGNVTSSNWNTTKPLTVEERTQVLDWLEDKGISREQVAARFNADDTRLEIANKLKVFFRE